LYLHNSCHTVDNVRTQQWSHALSNKLQVFYENLQVFYENLQFKCSMRIYNCSMRIYKYSMGFRKPAVEQSY